jgi:uncharacterized glyoxalase superfamily protein PhnB
MTVKKITPLLLADEVESCVTFWKERLGFEVAIEVPEGNKIGFVSLKKAGVELMYQSHASVEKDSSLAQGYAKGPSFLYIEVDSLDDVKWPRKAPAWSCRSERLSMVLARSG